MTILFKINKKRVRNWTSYPRFERCFQHVLKKSDNSALVSFDVFDTLLFRRCSPETVQWGVAAKLGCALGLTRESTGKILCERDHAYAEAASTNQSCGFDFEAHLDDINLAWVKRLAPNQPGRWKELANVARETKIQFEKWACYPNPAVIPLLEELQTHGKRLVFISDMYLGEAIISDLLSDCGLRHYFSAGYVSGDHALTKWSGRLFRYVLDAENIEAKQLLHLGDNAHADGRRAAEHGIRSLVIQERAIPVKRMQYDHRLALQDHRWFGFAAANFAAAANKQAHEPGIQAIGRDVLGPPFAAFIHGLVEYCLRIRPDAVYFLSREGMLLKDLYDALITALQLPLPHGGYLCASRLSASIAAMRGYGLREITLKLSADSVHTVRRIVSPLGFSPMELEELARTCGIIDVDQPINILESPAFARFVDHPTVQERAKKLGQEGRSALRDYLHNRGFFDANRVVFVDVGWAGQIQEGIQLALSDGPAPEFHVYYLGANRKADERRQAGLKIQADLADVSRYEWAGGATFEFVELFEIPSRAAHGTVVGHQNGAPLLMMNNHPERLPELPDEPRIALLQEGIRDYMLHYARYVVMMDMPAAHAMTYARSLVVRAVRFPRRNELRFFSSLAHVANFGSDERIHLAKLSSLTSPMKFLATVRVSHWRQGATALKLGRFGALALSVFREPRIRRSLPRQVAHTKEAVPSAHAAMWNPFTPLPHDFEAEVNRHARKIALLARMESAKSPTKNSLSLSELVWLHVGHRITNLNLRRKKLAEVPADLLPVRAWLWREIYIRLPSNNIFINIMRAFNKSGRSKNSISR